MIAFYVRHQDVGLANGAGSGEIGWIAVEGPRIGTGENMAVLQHGDVVGERERLALVVGDEYRCRGGFGEDACDVSPELAPQGRVKRAEGLVEQHDAGADCQCASERYPLLLAAGELMGVAPLKPVKPDYLKQPSDHGALPSRKAKTYVPAHGEMREESTVLGYVPNTAVLWANTVSPVVENATVDSDRAGIELLEPGDKP